MVCIAAIYDIDGVIRDVSQSYRKALADTVETFTARYLEASWRPEQTDIDRLKAEGVWNNDWEGSRELIYRAWERQGRQREGLKLDFEEIVAFFQSRYRGSGDTPEQWDGYINNEPLLVQPNYFAALSAADLAWGFFSGATRGSVAFVLQRRLQLTDPVVHAMEDGPEKPDPSGLLRVLAELETRLQSRFDAVVYSGDTTGDMETLLNARQKDASRQWKAVGIVPPHLWNDEGRKAEFQQLLRDRGASLVVQKVTELTPMRVKELFAS
ncbi:MAG: TIGR01548 family HAD-type hydrolase [Cyanobacteria bacterium P01_F01_bin.33]